MNKTIAAIIYEKYGLGPGSVLMKKIDSFFSYSKEDKITISENHHLKRYYKVIAHIIYYYLSHNYLITPDNFAMHIYYYRNTYADGDLRYCITKAFSSLKRVGEEQKVPLAPAGKNYQKEIRRSVV